MRLFAFAHERPGNEALRQAPAKNWPETREASCLARGAPFAICRSAMTDGLFRDLRFGARRLRRSPAFTSAAVLSLGLGIGGATAVFTLVNAIVLRRLPVPEPRELVQARAIAPGQEFGQIFSGPTFEHARDTLVARGAGELFAATSVAGMQMQ